MIANCKKNKKLVPFLKWAGGKRWLVEHYSEVFNVEYKRFIEPFLGSGAVFFKLQPKRAILSDSNEQLIETWSAVKEEHHLVVRHLRKHHRLHCKEYYYYLRSQTSRSRASRAAQFIYLNRTCWNGLYRVNLKGDFNVPIGTKSKVILESDDFASVALALKSVKLAACDFEETILKAKYGDLVFVDPPYTVKHNNNGFIKYNQGLFSWEDQIRLRDCVVSAVERGAHVIVTNAFHDSVKKLYSGVGEILRASRNSIIAADSYHRKTCNEMIIKCVQE